MLHIENTTLAGAQAKKVKKNTCAFQSVRSNKPKPYSELAECIYVVLLVSCCANFEMYSLA